MSAPTKKAKLEAAGIATDGLTSKEIAAKYNLLPADGKARKALAKYGVSSDGLSGKEVQEALKQLKGSNTQTVLVDRAYKVEIDPTDWQLSFLRRYVGIARHVYNWTWFKAREQYFHTHKAVDTHTLGKELTKALKEGAEPSWVADLPATARREAHGEVKIAYDNAFRRLREGRRGSKIGWPTKA